LAGFYREARPWSSLWPDVRAQTRAHARFSRDSPVSTETDGLDGAPEEWSLLLAGDHIRHRYGNLLTISASDVDQFDGKSLITEMKTEVVSDANTVNSDGSTHLLPRLIGEGKAKLLGMTGEIIAAEEAERIGLVNSVVEDRRLTSAVEELVAKLVSVGPFAVACVKEFFARSRDVDIDAAVMFENDAATRCFVSADQQEGLQAFLEKRKPRWSGR
jgi:hypothetical protein